MAKNKYKRPDYKWCVAKKGDVRGMFFFFTKPEAEACKARYPFLEVREILG